MPTTFVKGDLFEDSKGPDLYGLAFAADCTGAMDHGVAIAFKKHWPAFAEAFRTHAETAKMQPGDVFRWRSDDGSNVVVYALGVSRGADQPKLAAFVRSIEAMLAKATEDEISRIAIARIGGGLDATRVKRVLSDAGDRTTINLSVFEQFVRAKPSSTE